MAALGGGGGGIPVVILGGGGGTPAAAIGGGGGGTPEAKAGGGRGRTEADMVEECDDTVRSCDFECCIPCIRGDCRWLRENGVARPTWECDCVLSTSDISTFALRVGVEGSAGDHAVDFDAGVGTTVNDMARGDAWTRARFTGRADVVAGLRRVEALFRRTLFGTANVWDFSNPVCRAGVARFWAAVTRATRVLCNRENSAICCRCT